MRAKGLKMPTQLYLTLADQGRAMTLEEFEHAESRQGFRYELIDGKVEVAPAPNPPHEDVRAWLIELLVRYKLEHPDVINHVVVQGQVFVPHRPATSCPEPDITVYRDYPHHLPRAQRRWQDVSPLLVVEVLSPENASKDLIRNLELYALVPSIREYWIADPLTDADRPTLTVHRRRGHGWQKPVVIGPGGVYTTRLLPGLELAIDSPES
jgi:Uma2 family endonuclease